ncbi:MAG: hypothetical protein ACYS0I_14250 [Planctomycetota bacterium]|jgi:hypothetical protein
MNKTTLLARGREFQAELQNQSETLDLNGSAEKKTIELFLPPSVNATDFTQFMYRIQKTCNSCTSSASIMQINSYDKGTRIFITINASSFADILDRINGMSQIEKLDEYQEAKAKPRFFNLFAFRKSLKIVPSIRFHVAMKSI